MGSNKDSCTHKNHLHLINADNNCKHCQGAHLCLSFGLRDESVDEFKHIIRERGPYAPGDHIYSPNDNFGSLYSIQTGSVKTETVTIDGRQSVMGFYLSGDLIGIDAIGSKHYPNTAIALETTWLCEIPYEPLLEICSHTPSLQHKLINTLGSKIHSDEYSWKVVRNESAGRRVMHFLYQLYGRQSKNHIAPLRIVLPMSKQDLASFLGLTPESFSRTLTRLQNDGYLIKQSHKVLTLTKAPPSGDVLHSTFPDIK
ncbi:MAG: cyclic nucleotide-binding domain-containing protein [Motiliproteus sp.]